MTQFIKVWILSACRVYGEAQNATKSQSFIHQGLDSQVVEAPPSAKEL